jgi:hypothetical protein
MNQNESKKAMANQQPGGMTAPLQRAVAAAAAAAAANYPPVLPLTMHPALRGLCKPSQNLSIGLTAAAAAAGKKQNNQIKFTHQIVNNIIIRYDIIIPIL